MEGWTTAEEDALAALAGTMPAPEIAGALGRSERSVREKASRMGLSLRYRGGPVWCDGCATWRTEVDADGLCPVCRMRARTEAHRARYAEAVGEAGPRGDVAAREREDLARETRAANRWKKRVQRAREATGSNPRKPSAPAKRPSADD